MLLKYVHEKLINNQEIARLVYFNTRNPLSKKGIKYDGTKIDQPDLTDDDVKDLITLLPFNPQMKIELDNGIFLNIPMASFVGSNMLYLEINVVTAVQYFEITTGLRLHEIAHRITDMFDDMYITDESYTEELGNLRFKLDDIVIERLSSNSNMILGSLRFSIELVPFNRVVKR